MIPLKEWTNGTPDNNYQDGTQLDAADFESWHKEMLSVLAEVGVAADPAKTNQVLDAIKKIAWGGTGVARPTTMSGYGITDAVTRIANGQPLPAQNIGPIWHDDYGCILTWQVFNANGANYTGYASMLVGSLLLDTQSTPRTGYVKSGVQNLSRSAYAALRAWAMHNGIMVAEGAWQAGQIVCADNADGTTFRVYDVRGEFLRAWDDSRGVDVGRAFGSRQKGSLQCVDGDGNNSSVLGVGGTGGIAAAGLDAATASDFSTLTIGYVSGANINATVSIGSTYGGTSRPRNVALLASIKF